MNPFDVLEVINRLVDGGDFLEVQRDWTKTSSSALRGLKGSWWGWLPTSPLVKAGTIDINAADKASRFIRFCNIFNIPLITLVDVPGFLPGLARNGAALFGMAQRCCLHTRRQRFPRLR